MSLRYAALKILGVGLIAFSFLTFAKEPKKSKALVSGRLIKTLRASPVYTQASVKSKVLADVDAETILQVKSLSPRGLWIEVSDEDGNTGWIPVDRTDFHQSDYKEPELAQVVTSTEEKTPLGDSERKRSDDNKPRPPNNLTHMAGLVLRKGFQDPNGAAALGLRYSLMFKQKSPQPGDPQVGFESGIDRYFSRDIQGARVRGFVVPFKYKYLGRLSESNWATGPDFGLLWILKKSDDEKVKHLFSGSLGYSLGYASRRSGFYALLRPGFEFFVSKRFSLELQSGAVF